MKPILHRVALLFAFLLALVFATPRVLADGSGVLVDAGVTAVDAGSAAPVGAPAAPTFVIDAANPLASATSAWDLVKQSGWIWGGMAVLFELGTYVIKKAGDDHWLSNDHILAVGTTVIGVIGAIVNAHFGNGSWAAVLTVAVAGVALIIQKPKPASSSSSS